MKTLDAAEVVDDTARPGVQDIEAGDCLVAFTRQDLFRLVTGLIWPAFDEAHAETIMGDEDIPAFVFAVLPKALAKFKAYGAREAPAERSPRCHSLRQRCHALCRCV